MNGLIKILVLLCCAAVVVIGQNRTRPLNLGRYRPTRVSNSDGKYRPAGDGKYRGGNDGRYVHKDVKYVHDDRPDGGYSGSETKPTTTTKKPTVPTPAVSNNNDLFGNSGSGKPLPKGKGSSATGGGWKILQLKDKVETDGYHYLYETENGILAEESGKVQQLETDPGLRSKGFYEYTGDDGNLYRVDYVADDKGFVAQGDHIPPIPPHIPKLLAYLEANGANKK